MEEKLIQMESCDSISMTNDTNTTMCTTIGWCCDLNIKDTFDTFTKFLINAPNPQKNKKWISSTNIIQMDTYPKFGMYTSIDNDLLESNGCTLIITSEQFVDTVLHAFSANDFEDINNLRYYQGGRLTPRQRRNFTLPRFLVVTPYFFDKNKSILKKEYWSRIVVCGMENISLLQKMTVDHFRNDFLWIISPLLNFRWIEDYRLGSRNFHHGFNITKVPPWFKMFIDKRILQHIVVYKQNDTNVWKPELIRLIRYNSYESDTSLRFHVENTDYDRALQCVNNSVIESFDDEEETECGICLENLTDDRTRCKTECNHNFCKKCITQWFIRNYQCPTCRTSEPKMFYIQNYIPTNKTKYTKTLSFLRYISLIDYTINNSVVLYRSNCHESRNYFTTNFYTYNQSYEILQNLNIKRVFLLDNHNDQNDLLTFYKVNFPHIEEYVIFEYKPHASLRDSLL